MVGKQLIPKMLENSDANLYVLTHEKGTRLGRPEFMKDMLGMDYCDDQAGRLHLVPGDITKDNFGTPAVGRMKNRLTGIFHGAAETRFDRSLSDVRQVNVEGTKKLIDFARSCPRLQRFGFLSTVYVAGNNRGWIKEDFADPAGFINTYEQSKYEAEQVIRESSNLPWSIYRLSTMLGHSQTGETEKIITPHLGIRIIHKGLASLIPGDPNYPIDLVPSDYSIGVLQQLFNSHFEQQKIFHIASGKRNAITLQAFIDKCYKLFGYMDNDWSQHGFPKPVITNEPDYKSRQKESPDISASIRSIKHFADQFLCPKDFDSSNVRRLLPYYENQLPSAEGYIGKVILYCFKTNWGKVGLA